MAYRDETERLRARVEELERELETANARVAFLEQVKLGQPRSFPERLLGGPLRVVREVTVDRELTAEARPEIERTLSDRLGSGGQLREEGGKLTWTAGSTDAPRRVNVSIGSAEGRTTIVASEDVGNYATAGIGTAMVLVLLALNELRRENVPITILIVAAIVALVAARVAYSLFIARRERALSSLVRALAAIAASDAAEHQLRVRVEGGEPEEDAEEEPAKDVERPRRMR